jgi:hypothetical protein
LRALALAGRRQRHHAAHPGIHALRDALDDAAFSGGIPPLEDDDDLEPMVHDPVLQLHQFPLQPEQLLEIEMPVEGLRLRMLGEAVEQLGQPLIVDLHLQLLVEAVGDLRLDAACGCSSIGCSASFHGRTVSIRCAHCHVGSSRPFSITCRGSP